MKFNLFTLFAILLASVSFNALDAQTLEQKIDKAVSVVYPADGPGVAVLVARDGKVLYRKGHGMADLEFGLPMKADYVFRIGSITKQFTAAAILQLEEAGKLSLSDDITKYLPDYPTGGQTITIENLLNHTSGIKSYTGMEQFTNEWRRKDLTPDSLISFFKNEPMDFAPGENWRYNNSAYIILGYIIEKVSGMNYADYVEKKFFQPLGMKNSYYDYTGEIIPNRLPGYQREGEKYENANYLSMTLPYAAGSLLSTVDDLFTWYKAVAAGKIISPENLKKSISPTKIKTGNSIAYGYGLSTGNIQGSPFYGHTGGINGFLSVSLYLPIEEIFVVLLTNCDCNSASDLDAELAALALEKPYEWTEVPLDSSNMPEYQGVYEAAYDGMRTIRYKEGKLYSQISGGMQYELMPTGKDKFHIVNSLTDLVFNRNDKGEITSVTSFSRKDPIQWNRTGKEVVMREAIELPVEILNRYQGEYVLFPSFSLVISVENGELIANPTGQPAVVLHASSETKFYVEEVDAQVEFFKNDEGLVDKLMLYQGGQQIVGKKKN